MTHFVIDPVAIDFGFIQIHWYGLMYVLGFLVGYALAIYRIDRGLFPINREQMSDLLTWIALGVILGGRVGYMIFYQPERLLEEPLSLLFIWEGGMAFHGGLIGVIALTWIFARRHQVAPLALGDALAPLIPLGLGLGRLGNFIGGELWGRPTDMAWGMVFARADTLPRHPSQLYQFALEGGAPAEWERLFIECLQRGWFDLARGCLARCEPLEADRYRSALLLQLAEVRRIGDAPIPELEMALRAA